MMDLLLDIHSHLDAQQKDLDDFSANKETNAVRTYVPDPD